MEENDFYKSRWYFLAIGICIIGIFFVSFAKDEYNVAALNDICKSEGYSEFKFMTISEKYESVCITDKNEISNKKIIEENGKYKLADLR